jgi:hypothetical protein
MISELEALRSVPETNSEVAKKALLDDAKSWEGMKTYDDYINSGKSAQDTLSDAAKSTGLPDVDLEIVQTELEENAPADALANLIGRGYEDTPVLREYISAYENVRRERLRPKKGFKPKPGQNVPQAPQDAPESTQAALPAPEPSEPLVVQQEAVETPKKGFTPDRATQIRAELAKLQGDYEKKLAKHSKKGQGFVPPSIKGDVLSQITKKMDKLDAELKTLESPEPSKAETSVPEAPVAPPAKKGLSPADYKPQVKAPSELPPEKSGYVRIYHGTTSDSLKEKLGNGLNNVPIRYGMPGWKATVSHGSKKRSLCPNAPGIR